MKIVLSRREIVKVIFVAAVSSAAFLSSIGKKKSAQIVPIDQEYAAIDGWVVKLKYHKENI